MAAQAAMKKCENLIFMRVASFVGTRVIITIVKKQFNNSLNYRWRRRYRVLTMSWCTLVMNKFGQTNSLSVLCLVYLCHMRLAHFRAQKSSSLLYIIGCMSVSSSALLAHSSYTCTYAAIFASQLNGRFSNYKMCQIILLFLMTMLFLVKADIIVCDFCKFHPHPPSFPISLARSLTLFILRTRNCTI